MTEEQRLLKLAGLALTSDLATSYNLAIRDLWLIVSALQLTVAHPRLHEPMKGINEALGRKLQQEIASKLPEVDELLEMGWHREHDYIEQDDGEAPEGWYDEDDDWDDENENYS